MTPAVLLSSRAAGRYLLCLAGLTVLAALCAPYAMKLDLSMQQPVVILQVPELCAVLLICVGVVVLRPRMWIIDRLGVPSRRWLPVTSSALAIVGGPQLVLALAAPDSWALSATSALFLAGLAVLTAPFAGSAWASSGTALLYLALTMSAQLSRTVHTWSPVAVTNWPTAGAVPGSKVVAAVAVTTAALAVTIVTLGRTARTWTRDRD